MNHVSIVFNFVQQVFNLSELLVKENGWKHSITQCNVFLKERTLSVIFPTRSICPVCKGRRTFWAPMAALSIMGINIWTFWVVVRWWSWCPSRSCRCPSWWWWLAVARGRIRKNQTGILNPTADAAPLENSQPLCLISAHVRWIVNQPTYTSTMHTNSTPRSKCLKQFFCQLRILIYLLQVITTPKINWICRRSEEKPREWEEPHQCRSEHRFQYPQRGMVSPDREIKSNGSCCVLPACFWSDPSFLELRRHPRQPRPPARLSERSNFSYNRNG